MSASYTQPASRDHISGGNDVFDSGPATLVTADYALTVDTEFSDFGWSLAETPVQAEEQARF